MSHQVLSGQMDGQLDLFKTAGELRMMRAGDIAGGFHAERRTRVAYDGGRV